MNTEPIPVFVGTCPQCGGYLDQIPGAIVLTSDPPQYYVRCRRCGMKTISTKLAEVEEAGKDSGDFEKYTVTVYESVSICNSRSLDRIVIKGG